MCPVPPSYLPRVDRRYAERYAPASRNTATHSSVRCFIHSPGSTLQSACAHCERRGRSPNDTGRLTPSSSTVHTTLPFPPLALPATEPRPLLLPYDAPVPRPEPTPEPPPACVHPAPAPDLAPMPEPSPEPTRASRSWTSWTLDVLRRCSHTMEGATLRPRMVSPRTGSCQPTGWRASWRT